MPVGVGDEDRSARVVIVRRFYGKILPKRDFPVLHSEQTGENRIKPIGNVWKNRFFAHAIGHERKGEDFVRPVAGDHLTLRYPVGKRDRLVQNCADGVGIQVQPARFRGADRRDHRGRRRIGVFVGVQLGVFPVLGLFARNVGVHPRVFF
jgi:hypothetical protein